MRSATCRCARRSPTATYRVVAEYDGTAFCGFQFQPGLRTVAGELEAALSRLFARPVKVTAAGRTDAGVHALGQVISFSAHDGFPVERLSIALNSALPCDVSARDAAQVADDFSARLSALERRYVYAVLARRDRSAVACRFAHHEWRPLDVDAMRVAASGLIGRHDFTTFCADLPERGGTVRTLDAVDIEREGEYVRFHVRGKSFLHRMVRIVVGTLLDVGAGRRSPEDVAAMLAACDRTHAGPTASAQGLALAGVAYDGFDSAPATVRWPPLWNLR